MALQGLTGFGGLSSSGGGLDIDDLERLATEAGYKPPKPKGPGALERIFSFISAAETAPGVYASLTGEDPFKAQLGATVTGLTGRGVYDKKTYEDVISLLGYNPQDKLGKFAKAGAGVGLDILLDPTTYIGGFIGKTVKTGARVAGRAVTKVPKIGPKALRAFQIAEDLVVPGAKIKRLGPAGEKFWDEYLKFIKKTRAGEMQTAEVFAKLRKGAEELGMTGKQFTDLIEKGTKGVLPTTGKAPVKKVSKLQRLPGQLGLDFQDRLTPTQLKKRGIHLRSTDLKTILKNLPELGNNPLMKFDGEFLSPVSKSTTDLKVRPDSMGIPTELLKEGDVVDLNKVLKSKGNVPSLSSPLGQVMESAEEVVKDVTVGLPKKPEDQIVKILKDHFDRWFEEESKRGLIKEDAYTKNYISHILTPEAAREKVVTEMAFGQMRKPLRAKLGSSKARTIADGITEANKWSLEKYGYKLFQEDAFNIAAQRGVSHVRAVETHDFLMKAADQFGTKTPEAGQILKQSSAPSLKDVWFPAPIADHLDETYKFMTNDDAINEVLKVYDKGLSIWKGSVTGWFPAFHGRNMLGGIFNNWIGGVKNPVRYTQADDIARSISTGKNLDKTIELGGETFTYKQIGRLMQDNGVIGQPGYLDVMKQVEDVINPKTGLKKIGDYPKASMGFVEDRLRGAMFLDRIAKGDEAWDAAKRVIKFHFDYAPEGLADAEKLVAKRVIPFYTWTRNNIPLQLSQIVEQPGKYASVGKTLRALRGRTPEERKEAEALPNYMKGGFPLRMPGSDPDKPTYLYGLGLPVEDVNKMSVSQILSMTAPPIKTPLELATNRHFFFDKPLEDVKYAPRLLQSAPQPFKDWVEYSEYKNKKGETKATLNPKKWHFVSNLFGPGPISSRLFFTIEKLSDPDTMNFVKVLYATSGVKGKEVDIEEEKYYRSLDRQRELEEYLVGKGLLKKFERTYKPKE